MIASLSLDLDNKWSYMKTHGDEGWQDYPSYFDLVVPRILEFLSERETNITFFVVGRDAVLEKNRRALEQIAEQGHELANHSFQHEPWLHLYSPHDLHGELERTEQAIVQISGEKPLGFRGPGFSLSRQVLSTLLERGYEYDCSTFPTFLGPMARAYYFLKSGFDRGQKEERKELFGRFQDGFQRLRPYQWQWQDGRSLLEIPVTTMPVYKTPIHLSYLLYLSSFSRTAAKLYFWKALQLCRLFRVEPSILLHPLDFLGIDDLPDMAYFPGMKLPSERKLKVLSDVFAGLQKHFQLVNMREHAQAASQRRLAKRPIDSARNGVEASVANTPDHSMASEAMEADEPVMRA